MSPSDLLLLKIIRTGLMGRPLKYDPALGPESWVNLLRSAEGQELLPLVFHAVYRLPSFKELDKTVFEDYQSRSLRAATRQIVQANEFLTLLLHAQATGLDPVVMKGIIVRNLYPLPMLRSSVDEDLLILPNQVEAYHQFLLSEGLSCDVPDVSTEQEPSYHKASSPTYIELHTSPLPADSDAYGDCNALFDGVLNRTVTVQIEDVTVRTLEPTDHLLFLICHAYKHFLHSGVGIRPVCDIGMFSQAYGTEIDWNTVLSACYSISIDRFAAALFRISEKHLGFDMPDAFAGIDVDETDLLDDMLSGGLYGTADIDRLHSSNMTLEAVSANKSGKHRGGLLHSVFLPAKSLSSRYPYLRRFPVLLPVAWSQRIFGYLNRKDGRSKVSPVKSVHIGNERISLLKEYGIIK